MPRAAPALVAPLLLALSFEPPLGGQLGPVATQFWSAGSPDLVTSPQALALLGSALAGMAQVAARHWLAQDGDIPEGEAARIISLLAWRGLGSFPKVGG